MKRLIVLSCLLCFLHLAASAQQKDSTVGVGNRIITLSEVVVDKRLDVERFIQRIKDDSSFYKAFKNLRILGYTSINDIRMLGKKGKLIASLNSKTKQIREDSCRTMQVLEETSTGNMFDADHHFNYYTASMYASIFFTEGKVCGETNTIGDASLSLKGKSGMEKHKEQLKMLFFNPGKKIGGLPFIGNKTEIFSSSMADDYDMSIDFGNKNGTACYIFKQTVKPGHGDHVVIDEMTTWFDEKNYQVMARTYHLSYDALFYDFDVYMEVEMSLCNELQYPSLIRYNGNWKAIGKKRERGVFTATIYDVECSER